MASFHQNVQSFGFAMAGERMVRRLREVAFTAVSRRFLIKPPETYSTTKYDPVVPFSWI